MFSSETTQLYVRAVQKFIHLLYKLLYKIPNHYWALRFSLSHHLHLQFHPPVLREDRAKLRPSISSIAPQSLHYLKFLGFLRAQKVSQWSCAALAIPSQICLVYMVEM